MDPDPQGSEKHASTGAAGGGTGEDSSSSPAGSALPVGRPMAVANQRPSLSQSGPWRLGGQRLWEAWSEGWAWLLLAGVVVGLAGLCRGLFFTDYEARGELLRNPLPEVLSESNLVRLTGVGEELLPVLARLATSRVSLERIATRAGVAVSPDALAGRLSLTALGGGERFEAKGRHAVAAVAVRLTEALLAEVLATGRELQVGQIREALDQTQKRIGLLEEKLGQLRSELGRFRFSSGVLDLERERAGLLQRLLELESSEGTLQARLQGQDRQLRMMVQEATLQSPALRATREDLAKALGLYTEDHPRVKGLRAALAALEAEAGRLKEMALTNVGVLLPAAGGPAKLAELEAERANVTAQLQAVQGQAEQCRTRLAALAEGKSEVEQLFAQYQPLKKDREALAARQAELRLLEANASSGYRVLVPAALPPGEAVRHWREGLAKGLTGGLIGVLGAGLALAGLKWGGRRVRTEADLEAATGLPLLGSLGDLRRMSAEERQSWAFETFLRLRSRLADPDHQTLVCGFTSLHAREGRSTWIGLLAEEARRQGYRVLTLSLNGPDPAEPVSPPAAAREAAKPESAPQPDPAAETRLELVLPWDPNQIQLASSNALAVSRATWAWSTQGRLAWRQFLAKWNDIDNAFLFVELPPATSRETVLLAEQFPNLVWLGRKDMAAISGIRSYLSMLKQSRAHLVGAAFNRLAARGRKRRARTMAAALGLASLIPAGRAATEPASTPPPAPPPLAVQGAMALSASSPAQMGDWQKRLTLGPGDVVDISLFDQPETMRSAVPVGPDGRLSFLQAQDVPVSGLTVDEAREQLEKLLGKFHRSPRVVINPVAYMSKKYCVLGGVNQKGIYVMDRPLTVLEAVARARGFEVNAQNREVLLLADLSRSFLVRKGANGKFDRLNVDFEALFLRGDLSQNVPLAPEDYLYFPPLDLQEVYVLGLALSPGPVPYSGDMSVVRAIITRGGFQDSAWRKKILVIRGSLNNPQTFVVNTADILAAKAPDFRLKPGDIVYINRNPWYLPRELVKNAAMDFARSIVIYWTGKQQSSMW